MNNDKSKAFLKDAYSLQDQQSMQEFYKQWAGDYDKQMQAGLGYLSPGLIAKSLATHLPVSTTGTVVDIGCGTGLVARALTDLGYTRIDGIDFSQEMLDVARGTGVYGELIKADLTSVVPVADRQYAGAICAGTFTHNHVGPEALDEITRIVETDGLLAFTVHFDLWERDGFSEKLNKMVAESVLVELEREAGQYFAEGEVEGWFCVYRKCT